MVIGGLKTSEGVPESWKLVKSTVWAEFGPEADSSEIKVSSFGKLVLQGQKSYDKNLICRTIYKHMRLDLATKTKLWGVFGARKLMKYIESSPGYDWK